MSKKPKACPYCGATAYFIKEVAPIKRTRQNGNVYFLPRFRCADCKMRFAFAGKKRKKKHESKKQAEDTRQKRTWEENANRATATGNVHATSRAKALDQFLEESDVDLSVWEVERYVINEWGVTSFKHEPGGTYRTNFQIKVWLKRKQSRHIEKGFHDFVKKIPQIKTRQQPKFQAPNGVALEIAPFDAHIGKLAWEMEIGRRNFDLKQAIEDFNYTISQNLMWAEPFKPEKIFFILGQDLIHVDNLQGTTPIGGNILDVDSRLPKIYSAAFDSVLRAVYLCRTFAPTEVIHIPGNHDETSSWYMAHAIDQHFRNDDAVTVDFHGKSRKARLWGNLLVGWTHQIIGRHEKWANELAHEFPQLWGQSKFREWHHGHLHKKNEVKTFPVFTEGGVTCRQITALSEIDRWHYEHLFTDAVPGGEAYLWSKTQGVFSNFVAWTPERKSAENMRV